MSESLHDDMKVSLVIPVRNEESTLRNLIATIHRQLRQPDEIILVDGGSTDGTISLARQLTADDPRYKVIVAGRATPGKGRNIGYKAAQSDWIAFTDAGIELEPGWLKHLIESQRVEPLTDVVYGNFEPVTDSFFTRCAAMTYVSARVPIEGSLVRNSVIMSSLFRRSVLDDVGGYPDLRAGEDLKLIEEVGRQGYRIVRSPKADIWWELQPDFTSTFQRFYSYSFYNAEAGRVQDWHHGILRNYLVIFIFLMLGVVVHPVFAVFAVLLQLARAARYIWQRRAGFPMSYVLNPAQFLVVLAIVCTMDFATFAGWIKSLARSTQEPKY